MKNRMTRIAGIALIVGLFLSFKTQGLTSNDWIVLASFSLLGFFSGTVQATAIARVRQGTLSAGARMTVVILSVAALMGLKVLIEMSGVSHLPNTGTSLLIQCCFSIFGLFLGRGLVLGYHKQNAKSVF